MIMKLLVGHCSDDWNKNIIGVDTEVAANMAGRLYGAFSPIIRDFGRDVNRIWFAFHKLNISVQDVFKTYVNETFYQ